MQVAQRAPVAFRTTAVRPSPLGMLTEAAREVWSRRRLIRYLVRADIKKKGSDTVLGNLWWVLDPLLQMGVYVILLSVIFQRRVPDFPLFLFAAILPWKWFSSSINDAVTSVVGHERLIKQVQFPKLVLPVASVTAGIVNFGFGLIPLAVLAIVVFPAHLSVHVLWIPVIAVVQFTFTLALAFAVAAVNVFYRDVGNLVRHVMLLWFYLSPALWSFDQLGTPQSDLMRLGLTVLHLNPLAVILGAYRDAIYGQVTHDAAGQAAGFTAGTVPDLVALAVLLLVSCGLLALTTLLFKRLEPAFAKVL